MIRTRSTSDALDALASLRFSWAATPDDVWDPGPVHVAGLQSGAERALLLGMDDAWRTSNASPVGLALTGPKGVGKTHLLGWIRRQVQGGDGYFFLVQALAGTEFWRSVAQGVLDGLLRPAANRRDQLTLLLDTLGERTDSAPALREVLRGDRPPTRLDLDAFVSGLRRLDRQVGTESADGARALLLYNSPDLAQSDAGRAFLSLADDLDPVERAGWGLQRGHRSPQLVVRDLSRLLALTGQPTVIAVDQLDTLVAQSRAGGATRLGTDEDDEVAVMLDSVADGLMAMREETRRTLTVLSVLPATWRLIRRRATATATDRFREFHLLDAVPSAQVARDLLAAYLAHRYVAVDFDPPHPTWPVTPAVLRDATRYTARELLQRVDDHARRCVEAGDVAELTSWEAVATIPAARVPAHALDAHEVLDAEFERHRARADVAVLLDPESEDVTLPSLLRAALTCFVEEARATGDVREWVVDPLSAPRRPPLHARLRLVLDADTEDERHWAFRAVLVPHHRSVAGRVDDARVASGAAAGVTKRRLVLMPDRAWPSDESPGDGVGSVVHLDHEDVRTFEALRRLVEADPPGMREWLAERRPASRSALLGAVLADAGRDIADPVAAGRSPAPADPAAPRLVLGRTVRSGVPVGVPVPALARHVLVVGGTGSAREDLLQRVAGEVAGHGVPVLVVSDQGDRVEGLAGWPGLSTRPVPDLSAVRGEPGELAGAAAATAWSLATAAGLAGPGAGAAEGRGALAGAAEALAHAGDHGLDALRAALLDPSAGAVASARERRLAREAAEALGRADAPLGPEGVRLLAALYPFMRSRPATDGGLAGLVLLDDAHAVAPAGAGADVLVDLLGHAGRHGYGVVLGTSSPRDLDPRLAAAVATHVLGLLHSPAQVEAARDLARARGSEVPDVARLGAGTVAVATADTTFEVVRWRDA
ncbi:MAG: hypothetical protein ACFCVF_13345 [Kineosporiaceae bacterium]